MTLQIANPTTALDEHGLGSPGTWARPEVAREGAGRCGARWPTSLRCGPMT